MTKRHRINCDNKFIKSQEKIKDLIYIDDIKLFAKYKKKNLDILIQTIRIYSQNIRTKFRIEKCSMLKMRREKRQIIEGIKLPSQERIGMSGEKEKLQVLGNTGSGYHQTSGKERKIRKRYLSWMRKLLEIILYSRNLIKRIYTSAVFLVRFSGPFLKWTREEFQQMDMNDSLGFTFKS